MNINLIIKSIWDLFPENMKQIILTHKTWLLFATLVCIIFLLTGIILAQQLNANQKTINNTVYNFGTIGNDNNFNSYNK
jgi:hypothetical protein